MQRRCFVRAYFERNETRYVEKCAFLRYGSYVFDRFGTAGGKYPGDMPRGQDNYLGGTVMQYVNAFLLGGFLCAVGQVLIDRTKLTPARILMGYVVGGVLLTAVGAYKPLVEWGGAGATVPIAGFGYALAQGVEKAVKTSGWIGMFTGGLTATAGGITAAITAAWVAAMLSKPGEKS
jgi:stage V sporulation protein AE